MKKLPADKFLRVPVRYVDERWECEYGGLVPVKEGTEAELVVNVRSISDRSFIERMREPSCIRVLDQGAKLRVLLATKDGRGLTAEQRKVLIPSGMMRIATAHLGDWNTGQTNLVEVTIGEPTDHQAKRFETKAGGLWLLTQGHKPVGLQSTKIHLPAPVSEESVHSLNHAFTKLSEVFEPWRISHTGNVYRRFLYEEKDGTWYPLDLLRQAAMAEKEQQIAFNLWQDFLKRMSAGAPTGKE